ncbi:MAG: hypothetical protein AAF492_17530, partial [Verrucomicrobiota bacterium]
MKVNDKLLHLAALALLPFSTTEAVEPTSGPATNPGSEKRTTVQEEAADRVLRGDVLDASHLVFEPHRWQRRRTSTHMIPWEGESLVFLVTEKATRSTPLDDETLKRFTAILNRAWAIYDTLIPGTPPLRKSYNGKTVMLATPGIYACGLGCGFIGMTGIEVTSFYATEYPNFRKEPDAFRNYYFYEMGRNWYLFGDRLKPFTTSFAVHMRHVCMRRLKLKDIAGNPPIEGAYRVEKKYAESKDVSHYDDFMANHTSRLRRKLGDGYADRNTIYAGIMLRLEDQFGATFLPRYYRAVMDCPPGKSRTHQDHTINWIVACSYGAQKDLSELFQTRYHVPLGQSYRDVFGQIDWADPDAVENFQAR